MQWSSERSGSLRWAGRSLAGLVGAILCLDVLLLLVPASGGTVEAVRVILAVAAALTVPLAVGLGLAYRPIYAIGGLLAAPLVAVYVVSGLLLPWNQLAFYTGQRTLEALLAVPAVGDRLAAAAFGGFTLSQRSLRLAFRYHYAVVGLAAALGGGVYVAETRRATGE
ncbi:MULTISPECIES: hypothetical protein [unclassified Halorubrum]|uniref:hypothetical protein n=1 Tax=unclassified Halorubrum TaxID=2642239 RepID=UPI000B99CECE|nr:MULTISPECIES: hypothetical protein [unclassified Halorubrum]OYR40408.1 hypothetical protein DJ81_14385 [Halorubrum sp. Hd13]OYR49578.1 hypothetical protein DJ74_08285 [Halorubrum sp. Ea8]